MAKLIIFRGLPGSGKTTLAKSAYRALNALGLRVEHLEADMFFEDKNGEYKYDHTKIKDAHEWCQEQTKKFLLNGVDVIVSNTFTRKWEIDPYLKMLPRDHILILVATGNYNNVHGVPNEVIEKMKERWEDIEDEVIVTGV
jgi:tRNA uridine 5-carbamoylmethylation protein Kti12